MRPVRRQPDRTSLLAAALLLVTLAASTAGWAAPLRVADPEPAVREIVVFDEQTREQVFEFAVEEGTEAVRLIISARVKSGKVTWILEDADGERRLSGRGIRGRVQGDTGKLSDPPAGKWILTLSTERASGWTRFEWFTER